MEALSGLGEPAQTGLHRRDLDEDQHVAQARLGPQGTKGLQLGSPRRNDHNLTLLTDVPFGNELRDQFEEAAKIELGKVVREGYRKLFSELKADDTLLVLNQ